MGNRRDRARAPAARRADTEPRAGGGGAVGRGPSWPSWLLVPLVLVAFAPALGNGFAWDDQFNFLANPGYRGLGPDQFRWAWTAFHLGVYQPLAWLLLSAQYEACRLDPRGYHLTSLALHAANALVADRLIVALVDRAREGPPVDTGPGPRMACAFAAGCFAVHPLRVEAVAWASCQPYLLCALGAMLATLAYLRAHTPAEGSGPRWSVAAVGLFAAALLSKAAAVGLPAALLVLDVYPLRRLGPGRWRGPVARRAWLEKVQYVVLALIASGLAVRARMAQAPPPLADDDLASRVIRAGYAAAFYLLKTVAPVGLTARYPLPDRGGLIAAPYLLGLAATVGLSGALLLLRRRLPGLLAGWVAYLAILAPTLGMVRTGTRVIAADRYSYLASLALAPCLAVGVWRLARLGRRPWWGAASAAAGLAILLGLVTLTRRQCEVWHDSATVFAHALQHAGGGRAQAHFDRGQALDREGRAEEADRHYRDALQVDPGYASVRNNLGYALALDGRLDEAVTMLSGAVRLRPDVANYRHSLGFALARRGDRDAAIRQLTEALRLDPAHGEARRDLDALLRRRPGP